MSEVVGVANYHAKDINDALTRGEKIEIIDPKASDMEMMNKIQAFAKKKGREQEMYVLDFTKKPKVSIYESPVHKMLANCRSLSVNMVIGLGNKGNL